MSYARTYARRIPSVPTYNGVGSSFATERTTAWNIPVKSPYDGVGIWPFDDDSEDVGEGEPLQVDQTAPPTYCPDGSIALVSNGVSYCAKADGSSTPAVTPTPTPAVTPPKVTPTPAAPPPAIAPPPAPSSSGLSTGTLVGGGLAALAVVGGLVYWKKKKGGRR